MTWYIAQIDSETAERMGRAFTARYPGVRVSVIRTTGQVAYERLTQDLKNNAPQCDVFSSTDIAQYPALKKRGALAEYRAGRRRRPVAGRADNVSDPGFYYPSAMIGHLMIYNSAKVKPEDAPKSLDRSAGSEMERPRRNRSSGVQRLHRRVGCRAAQSLMAGRIFEKLAKNNPRVGRSGNDPVTLINAAECLVGPAPAGTAFQQVDRGNPDQAGLPRPMARHYASARRRCMASAPHPNAARLFQDWLISEEYARLSVENHNDPVRPGLTLTSGQKSLDEVKVLGLTVEEIAKGVPEVIEQWRDTFGG